MSKALYTKVAARIKTQVELSRGLSAFAGASVRLALNDLANGLIDDFEAANPLFDRTKFKAACGLLDSLL